MTRYVFIYVFFIGMFFYSGESFASFRVCNYNKGEVGVALGQPDPNGGWITKGWWHIPANSCDTLVKGALTSRYYYLYAESRLYDFHWSGNIPMCVGQDVFSIIGVNDCYARGYTKSGFVEYDTGQHESWTVQLTQLSSGKKNKDAKNAEPT